ncbi:MAG TPA: SpoVG family protein [Lachnospiraceae bacterium]|nr:SpoVG family protein [Lachnospiraceae bacterium]
MKYSIKVNSINSKDGSNIKGFATVVFGDSFKITNIAILENKDKDQLYVSMPRYKSSERDENGATIYKDVCNPITAEFREELYTNILEAYERAIVPKQDQVQESGKGMKSSLEMPEFSVTVSPYEKDGSNIKGLARIYIEESFIVNNVNILQGKENIFVSMPAYKTKQIDEQGKPIYQDICYPVTKEFREKLYTEIVREYELAKVKSQNQAKDIEEKPVGSRVNPQEKEATPFR